MQQFLLGLVRLGYITTLQACELYLTRSMRLRAEMQTLGQLLPTLASTASRLGFMPMVLVASGIAAANAYGFMPVVRQNGDEILNIWLQV